MSDDKWQQLLALRAMTERTGTLHEAQVMQLKVWPRLLFQQSVKSFSKIDMQNKRVVFTITNGPKAGRLKHLEVKVRPADAPRALDEWVKALLGSDWGVKIQVKDKKGTKTFSFPGKAVARESVADLCRRLAEEDRKAATK